MSEKMQEALERIVQWADAYPIECFPEMEKDDWKLADNALKLAGLSLTRISASNMRHVVTQVGEIARNALKPPQQTESKEG